MDRRLLERTVEVAKQTKKLQREQAEKISALASPSNIDLRTWPTGQGPKARYMGTRRNVFDLRRLSAVQNLESIARVGMTLLIED